MTRIIPVRLILDAAPGSLEPRVRDYHARAHLRWVKALEGFYRAKSVQNFDRNSGSFSDIDPDMIPGDRGLSRSTEAKLPRNVRESIDRQLRTAQVSVDKLNGHANSATRRAFGELQSKILNMAKDLSRGKGKLSATQNAQLQSAIDRELKTFQVRLNVEWTKMQRRAARAGAALADAPIELVGAPVPRIEPPPDLGTGDLFDTLKDRFKDKKRQELTDKINQMRRGDIGTSQAINELQGIIQEPQHAAERIMRTEAGRAAKQTANERMERHGKLLKGMQKRWVAAFVNSRTTHKAAHNQVVDADKDFKVGRPAESAAYPMDPRLSAKESVNCMCVSSPVVDKASVDIDAIL